MYTWNGNPAAAPGLRATSLTSLNIPGSYEGIAEVPNPLSYDSQIQVLMDNGTTEYYADGIPSKSLTQPLYKKFRSVVVPLGVSSDPFTISQQKTLGGSAQEGATAITATTDGGYVVVGGTYSNNGDVTGNHGDSDAWIVRVNSTGSILWRKTLGGTASDQFLAVKPTADGGFVTTGITYSNDGDVAGLNHGSSDLWVVKFSSDGNVLWQKCLGGTDIEWGFAITPTSDGGVVAAGRAHSFDGDVKGQHGGLGDFWIVRLDNTGKLVWQKTLGGTSGEEVFAITPTTDGGVVAVGYTFSSDGDVIGHHGPTGYSSDFWIVKLNSAGALVWQKTLGGSLDEYARAITATSDGGFLVAGRTASNDGDVFDNHGSFDFWVVKLSSTGDLLWQRPLGGSAFDEAFGVATTSDGGAIVSGFTQSNDNDVSGNHGNSDVWVLRLTSTGSIVWQKTYGGSANDASRGLSPTTDGGYLVAGSTASNDGDLTGNHSSDDFWVIKLGGSSSVVAPAPAPAAALALEAPIYNCQTGAITFQTSGGDGSPITFQAPGITDWTTNPNQFVDKESRTAKDAQSFNITAQQNGVSVNYYFNLREFCQTGTPLQLQLPTYDCQTGAITFRTMGGDGSTIEYSAIGITGWTTNPNQFVDKESRTASDVQPFTLLARQSGQTASFVWNLRSYCQNGTPLQLLAPTYDCSTGAFRFNTSGGDGSLIEYMAAGITGWTTNPNQFVDKESRTANDVQPFVLMARQSGVTLSYVWNLKASCGRARLAATESATTFSLKLLGNPVSDVVRVMISGAEGNSVHLQLLDTRGRLIEDRLIKQTLADDVQEFQIVQVPSGLLLLQATNGVQRQVIKAIKP